MLFVISHQTDNFNANESINSQQRFIETEIGSTQPVKFALVFKVITEANRNKCMTAYTHFSDVEKVTDKTIDSSEQNGFTEAVKHQQSIGEYTSGDLGTICLVSNF